MAVARLREHHGWPRFVHAGRGDQQLRLDLDNATDVDLFREHLRRATGPIVVAEAPAPAEHGWIDGRAHEIVVPLASTTPPAAAPPALTRRPWVVVTADHGDLPGAPTTAATGPIVSARLACRADAIDTIVVDHLPALLNLFAVPPQWWYLRHRHPAPSLRLRLHVAHYGEATELLGRWAAHLRRQGLSGDLTLDTYRPEAARYGPSAAARGAVERLFAADSTAARAQLQLAARQRQLDPVALTTASMIDLVTAAHSDREAALAWLVARADLEVGTGRTNRAQLAQVLNLLDPPAVDHINAVRPADAIQREVLLDRDVAAEWRERSVAVHRYGAAMGQDPASGRTDQPPLNGPLPDTVLVSWLHLHHVRTLGIDPAGERRCHRLAR
ncbi:MAG: thiopeptide-type bacteriocin biosynthesis protein, partial [Actinomycetes bacterium]